jgi:Esterase/lipase
MKVSLKMIAKDLRLAGFFYMLFPSSVPKKRRVEPKATAGKRPSKGRLKDSRNVYLSRADGSALRLLVIERSKAREDRGPGVLWIHGGGYALGMPEMAAMSMARHIAKECLLVSPEYRLSVEAPYPAALEDCYRALLWMKEKAAELGIRDDQLFVGGESAGGGLAIALCLLARDRGEVKVACQMPLYPMIDDRQESESMRDNDAPVWNAAQNSAAWDLYLGGLDRQAIPKYAAPARESDLSGMPPAISFAGGVEPFRDETRAYVARLKNAGVRVDFAEFEGAFHAFDMMAPWTRSSKLAVAFFMRAFHSARETCFAQQGQPPAN